MLSCFVKLFGSSKIFERGDFLNGYLQTNLIFAASTEDWKNIYLAGFFLHRHFQFSFVFWQLTGKHMQETRNQRKYRETTSWFNVRKICRFLHVSFSAPFLLSNFLKKNLGVRTNFCHAVRWGYNFKSQHSPRFFKFDLMNLKLEEWFYLLVSDLFLNFYQKTFPNKKFSFQKLSLIPFADFTKVTQSLCCRFVGVMHNTAWSCSIERPNREKFMKRLLSQIMSYELIGPFVTSSFN